MSGAQWVPVIAAAVPGGMALWHWRRYALGEASRRWRPIPGTVVDVWFDVQEKRDADGDHYVSTDAHLVYDYVVAGQRYRSRHFTYRGARGLGEREAYALLSGIRKGQTVEVRYDPNRPQRAVVLPGTDRGNVSRIAGWALIALIVAVYAFDFANTAPA